MNIKVLALLIALVSMPVYGKCKVETKTNPMGETTRWVWCPGPDTGLFVFAEPFILVRDHDFPGKVSRIKVDDNNAITLTDGAGDERVADTALALEQMLSGSSAMAEFYKWPNDHAVYSKINIKTFRAAWAELLKGAN